MKGFVLGIVTMLFVLVLGMVFALMGFVSMRADNPPSKMETKLAGRAMDASVARAAPKMANPISTDEADLATGDISQPPARSPPGSQASFHRIQRCDRSRPQATMNRRMQRVFRFTLAGSWIGGTGECRGR
jgi:hypothetical protein